MYKKYLMGLPFLFLRTSTGRSVKSADSSLSEIQTLISRTAATGGTVSIPKGEYRISNALRINNAHDLVLDGNGSTLIVSPADKSARFYEGAVIVNNSQRVTLRNFTIDYDPLPYTQGVISAIAPDGSWCELTIDQGYRTDLDYFAHDAEIRNLSVHLFDPQSNQLKRNGFVIYTQQVTSPSPGVFRFSSLQPQPYIKNQLAVGDIGATSSYRSIALRLVNSASTVVDGVTIWSSGGGGLVEMGGEGGSDIKVQMTPGPKPAGATRNRVFASIRDGYHTVGVKKGANFHDSLIECTGDDGLNAFAFIFEITAIDKATQTVTLRTPSSGGKNLMLPGDQIVIWDKQSVKQKKQTTAAAGPENTEKTIKLEDVNGIEVGDILGSPDRACNGLSVRNSIFRNLDGRGIVSKASDSVIEKNRVERTGNAGIALGVETQAFYEGPYSNNVTIRGNTLIDTGISMRHRIRGWGSAGAIVVVVNVQGDPARLQGNREHKNIVIEDNTIQKTSVWGLVLSNISQATVRNNRFSQTNSMEPTQAGGYWNIKPTSAILVRDADHVQFENNTISELGKFANAAMAIDPTTDQQTIDKRGIKLI